MKIRVDFTGVARTRKEHGVLQRNYKHEELTWTTIDGDDFLLPEISDTHLVNIAAYLDRRILVTERFAKHSKRAARHLEALARAIRTITDELELRRLPTPVRHGVIEQWYGEDQEDPDRSSDEGGDPCTEWSTKVVRGKKGW